MNPRILILASGLALAACPTPGQPPKGGVAPALPPVAEAVAHLRAHADQRKTMRASARVTYFGEKGRVRLRAVIVVQRPSRFRLETVSPLEEPIDVMASDGAKLWLLSKGRFHQGIATPENVARVIPAPLDAADLADAMLGGVPSGGRFEATKIEWADADHERWKIHFEGAAGDRAELVAEPADRTVRELVLLHPGGGVRVRAEFGEHEAIEGAPGAFPREIKLHIPEKDHEVTIKLLELEVNVSIDPGLFRLTPPPGVTPEPLGPGPVAAARSSTVSDK